MSLTPSAVWPAAPDDQHEPAQKLGAQQSQIYKAAQNECRVIDALPGTKRQIVRKTGMALRTIERALWRLAEDGLVESETMQNNAKLYRVAEL